MAVDGLYNGGSIPLPENDDFFGPSGRDSGTRRSKLSGRDDLNLDSIGEPR